MKGTGPHGKLNDDALYKNLYNNVPDNLVGYVPKDGAKYGITTGSRAEWAKLQFKLAKQESSGQTTPSAEAGHTGTAGLFQMESADLARHGQRGKSVTDPQAQIGAMNDVFKNIPKGTGTIADRKTGAGAYFGPIRDTGVNAGVLAKHEAEGARVAARNPAPTDTQTANANGPQTASIDPNQVFGNANVNVPKTTVGGTGAPVKGGTGAITGASTTAGTNPDGSPLPDRVQAVGGEDPKAFITHHTGGGGTPEGVRSTLRQRGLGVEYIMDQNGNIVSGQGGQGGHGGAGAAHMLPSGMYDDRGGRSRKVGDFPEGDPRRGLTNQNVVGMEIIASDDPHVKAIQAQKYAEFMAKRYPTTNIYGHGEVNVGHKEKDEGLTAKRAALALRAQGGNSAVAANSNVPGAAVGGYPSSLLNSRESSNEPLGLDRGALDRKALNDAMSVKHNGSLKVDVSSSNDLNTKASYKGDGLFKNTTPQPQTAMPDTPRGPSVADTASSYMKQAS